MSTHASESGGPPVKRARYSPTDTGTSPNAPPSVAHSTEALSPREPKGHGAKVGQSSSFRNVSACNRCRLRKNKCDQRLPSCASCDKANVRCVGYDPITKREIPRSYVFHLETRLEYLETVLRAAEVPYAPAEDLDLASRPGMEPASAHTPVEQSPRYEQPMLPPAPPVQSSEEHVWDTRRDDTNNLDRLVSNIGQASVQGASDSRYLGSTSGISFARVVFAAVKSSVNDAKSERSGVRPSEALGVKTANGGTSMRDSFFGLQTKPTIKQAVFPERELALRLVTIFFEYSNCQMPILHRGEFMSMFDGVYANSDRPKTPRELYTLNIVFAIGAGIFLDDSSSRSPNNNDREDNLARSVLGSPNMTRSHRPDQQCQPEEYHASAIVHLEACLSSTSDRPEGSGGGLEELQYVLLLAGFALLRPVAPGLWYIVGVAVRLAVDLGLHYEDGKDIDVGLEEAEGKVKAEDDNGIGSRRESAARERGRREWIRDLRRRLWWCTYAFDRLVSSCVGRPFGITDQVITTEFPSLLDDKYITKEGFLKPEGGLKEPTYKRIAYHYFRLRLLQSEILQVLQFQQAQMVRATGANHRNPYMHTQLPSPFLARFNSFRSWRIDVDRRLWQWKESAPSKADTGVQFSPDFLELNYWQAIIMLYRQSLSVPAVFEGEFSTSNEVESPSSRIFENREDEERVYLKVAEAGQRTLRLYRSLHRLKLVNYTFLATHHLFMAGISFLYAIWHSPIVRSRLTMDEVDFTILSATSVLGDLIEKCPPAEACRDAFDRMSKATVQMCMSTTGFSSGAGSLSAPHRRQPNDYFGQASSTQFATSNARSHKVHQGGENNAQRSGSRPIPNFDMGLNDLFPASTPRPSERVQLAPMQNQNDDSNHEQNQTQNQTQTQNQNQNQNQNTNYTMPPPQDPRAGKNSGHKPKEQYQMQQDDYTSPQEYAQPSAIDNSAIDPSLLPPRQQQQQSQQQSFDTYQTPSQPFNNVNFSAIDFLNSGLGLDANSMSMAGDQTGIDLGFGLGWEGMDHDFSEGGQHDLFDGFFFGGSGAGF